MEATVAKTGTEGNVWGGGQRPMGARYGKMMMWFFLASDALTFSSFLAGYGLSRFKFIDVWPIADDVFNEIPFIHGEYPMIYPAFMTFLLIFSSVTMVLAVHAGHNMERRKVTRYLAMTILGGLIFIGSQAFEWAGFINGAHGAIETTGGQILQVYNKDGEVVKLADVAALTPTKNQREQLSRNKGLWFEEEKELPEYSLNQVIAGIKADQNLLIRLPNTVMEPTKNAQGELVDNNTYPYHINKEDITNLDDYGEKMMLSREASIKILDQAKGVVQGANLTHNEYGVTQFADFFFFITGFHGTHVTIGLILLIITFINVLVGTYEKRGHYRMVEKMGLYWHFVDLVWVFVFTFFYLV